MNTPKNIALFILVSLLGSVGVHPTALAWEPFRKANPDVEQGNVLLKEDKADAALERYNKAARKLPDEPGVPLNRGLALLKKGETQQAKEAFIAAAVPSKTSDLRGDAYYNLGVGFALEGDAIAQEGDHKTAAAHFQESVDAFKRSLRKRPGHRDAAWNLEYAKKRLEEEKQAAEEEEKEEQEESDEEQDEQDDSDKQEDQEKNQDDKQDGEDKEQDESQEQQDPQEQDKDEEPKEQEGSQDEQEQEQQQEQQQEGQEPAPQEPAHVKEFLDALEQNEESLPLHRARQRSRARRPPDKDW